MPSTNDLPARPAGTAAPALGPARPRGRRVAALLAAAAPLAAALATAPAAAAFAASAPPAARPSHTLAAELLTTGTLPAITAQTGGGDPKLPPYVGD